jgi:hypothetical protein
LFLLGVVYPMTFQWYVVLAQHRCWVSSQSQLAGYGRPQTS